MVAAAGLSMDWQPRHQFANDLYLREVNREQSRRTRVQFTSIEKRLEDMDLMGIDIQAITPSPAQTFYSVPADLGIETARVINDNIADICGKHPDRFVGLGTVPFQAPELAVAELDRLHKFAGAARHRDRHQCRRRRSGRSRASGRSSSAPKNWASLCLCTRPASPEANRFRDHYFTNIIGNPLDTTVAVHHLIFGGVLQDCPNLKLVLSHGGGFLPAYSGRIDHGASARPDTCECLRHMPTTYLKRLYFDTIVYTHHQLRRNTSSSSSAPTTSLWGPTIRPTWAQVDPDRLYRSMLCQVGSTTSSAARSSAATPRG